MGNDQSTRKKKSKIVTEEERLKELSGITIDVNVRPPNFSSSKKSKKKKEKEKRIKRVEYFDCRNDQKSNFSRVDPVDKKLKIDATKEETCLEKSLKTLDRELKNVSVAQNGMNFCSVKPTLLQQARLAGATEAGINSNLTESHNAGSNQFQSPLSASYGSEVLTKNLSVNVDKDETDDASGDDIRYYPRYMGCEISVEADDAIRRECDINNINLEKDLSTPLEIKNENASLPSAKDGDISAHDNRRVGTVCCKTGKTSDRFEIKNALTEAFDDNYSEQKATHLNSQPSSNYGDNPVRVREEKMDVRMRLPTATRNAVSCYEFGELSKTSCKGVIDGANIKTSLKSVLPAASRSQRNLIIAKTLQSLRVTTLDSKLFLPDSLEIGMGKSMDLFNCGKIPEFLCRPGTMINLFGRQGLSGSDVVSVIGLKLVENRKIACLTTDCSSCNNERDLVRSLLKTFKMNFDPLPDHLLGPTSCVSWPGEVLGWLGNYINFHGQLQHLVLLFDGVNVSTEAGRLFVNSFLDPLLKSCIRCLSILLYSSEKVFETAENLLEVVECRGYEDVTKDQHIDANVINKQTNQVTFVDGVDTIPDGCGLSDFDNSENNASARGFICKYKFPHQRILAFRLPNFHSFTPELIRSFVGTRCVLDAKSVQILADAASTLRMMPTAAKIMARTANTKPKSFKQLLKGVGSHSHPCLILLENELATEEKKKFENTSRLRIKVTDHQGVKGALSNIEMKAHAWGDEEEPFRAEKLSASVILTALEVMDDGYQTMTDVLWLMSEFKSGFDVESATCCLIANKAQNAYDDAGGGHHGSRGGRVGSSSSGCGDVDMKKQTEMSKELQEWRLRVSCAIKKLEGLGMLHKIRQPVTFPSFLCSRKTSLVEPLVPRRYQLPLKNRLSHGFDFDLNQGVVEKATSRFRIPQLVLSIAKHLRPEYFGQPKLVLHSYLANKLISSYQSYYNGDSFVNARKEIDLCLPDLVATLGRNFFTDLDFDLLKNTQEIKTSHPLLAACQCLATLPGAIFLTQVLPLSAYKAVFRGLSDLARHNKSDNDTRDASLECRALLSIVLRLNMAVKDRAASLGDNDGDVEASTQTAVKPSECRSSKGIIAVGSVDSGIAANYTDVAAKRFDNPGNLFNFQSCLNGEGSEKAAGCDDDVNNKKEDVAEMITRIRFLLFQINKVDRAYFYYVMGLNVWPVDREQSAMLMRKSLEMHKEISCEYVDSILPNFGHACTLIASETYSWMLSATDKIQAARHVYNMADSFFASSSSSSASSPLSLSSSTATAAVAATSRPASSSSSSYYSPLSYREFPTASSLSPCESVSRNYHDDEEDGFTEEGSVHRHGSTVVMNDRGKDYASAIPRKTSKLSLHLSSENQRSESTSTANYHPFTIFTHYSSISNQSVAGTLAHGYTSNSYDIRESTVANMTNHPIKLRGWDCRRKIWGELGLLARAREAAISGVELCRAWWGNDHPATSAALMGLCQEAERSGRIQEAVDACVRALVIRLKFFGERDLKSIESCTVLSRLLLKCSMLEESLELAGRARNMVANLTTPSREEHAAAVEKIIEAVRRKKAIKMKRESAASNASKSVTFPEEICSDIVDRKHSGGDDGKNAGESPATVAAAVGLIALLPCTPRVCKFDPELAQTFHRCMALPKALAA